MTSARLCIRPFQPFLSAATLTFILPFASHAQTTAAKPQDARIGSFIELVSRTRSPQMAAISPDGKTVAWSVRTHDGTQIHISDLANPDPAKEKTISAGTGATNCSNSDPVWSSDGDSLSFTSTCTGNHDQSGQEQIFIWSKKTGTSKQVTHVTGNIDNVAWSPNCKSIAFLFVENATRSAGALAAMKPWDGVYGEDGVEVQRIGAVDLATGSFSQVTPAKLHVYEFDWSPDSKQLAYVAAPPPGENTWWIAQLYTASIANPTPKSILDTTKITGPLHGLQIAVPHWSPDGKQIAFIGGIMSDQGSTGGDIYVMPSTGGEPQNLTPGRAASPANFLWDNDHTLAISEEAAGGTHIFLYDIATKTDSPTVNATFPESVGAGGIKMGLSVSNSGNIATIRSSYEHPPEVWAGHLKELKQITHLNDALKPVWGKTESIEWTNEGFHVQGWLLYPANYDASKKYPLLVDVHGGPSAGVVPRWPSVGYGGVPFSALGYFVFMPNPRGSFGQGEKFTQANVKDFGYGDLRDILAGMDVLEKRFPIDKDREGLTGWSYGGFMTMFGVTQTTRFKAAVAGAGISDWKSYYGENSIDQWMIPFFGASVYDDPAIYAKSSAIEFIKNVKTPTLVIVGDRDGECPAPQSFEFWHALRAEGVKTQLVVYPDEGHAFKNPEHRRDVMERALNWFETEMPAK
jgi:dipeptidyl aminopeptidase/acylaminoacyl peptidase